MTKTSSVPNSSARNGKIHVGVIGCGRRFYNMVLPAIRDANANIHIAQIYDPNPDSIQFTRDLVGLTGFEPVKEYRQILDNPQIDWVMVGSWNAFHEEHIIASLGAGKHVFTEKPMATTIPACRRIKEAWEASGRLLAVGFVMRYTPFYVRIKELLDQGIVGNIVSFEFNETLDFNSGGFIMRNWRRDSDNSGGHLLEKCCHDFDVANWFVGAAPTHVASFGGTDFFKPANRKHIRRLGKNDKGIDAYYAVGNPLSFGDPFGDDHDVVDNQVVIVQYANNVRATFHTNINCGMLERRFFIVGDEGAIRADFIKGTIEHARIGFNEKTVTETIDIRGCHGGGDSRMVQELEKNMRTHSAPAAGVEDGIKATVVCLGADESRKSMQVVDLAKVFHTMNIGR